MTAGTFIVGYLAYAFLHTPLSTTLTDSTLSAASAHLVAAVLIACAVLLISALTAAIVLRGTPQAKSSPPANDLADDLITDLIAGAADLDELRAGDVMTDRTRLITLPPDATATDVITRAHHTGHSRFPITGESRDDILGLVHLRRAISVPPDRRPDVPAAAIMDDAPRVPETMTLRPLMNFLREQGRQMAIVEDEYGGTAGIVTLEDVVEELGGDVADEHDPRRAGVLYASDGTWSVPGHLRPDELAERTGLRLPTDPDYETLAGLVMKTLADIPQPGASITIAQEATTNLPGNVTITVDTTDGRRIDKLRVKRTTT